MNILLNLVLKNPKKTIFISFLISLFSLTATYFNLKINTSTDSLINTELEFKKNQKKLKDSFSILNNNILIRLKDDDEKSLELLSLKIIEKLKSNTAISFVYSPNVDKNFQKNFFLFLNDDEKEKLIENLYDYQPFLSQINNHKDKLEGFNNLLELSLKSDSNNELDEFAQVFKVFYEALQTKNTVNWTNLLSSNEKEFFILVGINQDYLDIYGFKNIYEILSNFKSDFSQSIEIDYTGGLIIDYEEVNSVSSGAIYSGLLSFILVGLLLWFAFKNLLLLFSILITIFLGLLITLGITSIVIGHLNLISVAFAVLFIGLSVDYGIQICSRMKGYKITSVENRENIFLTSKTLFIASAPSIMGFLSFIPTDYIGLSELGIISAIGLIIGLIVNITFLPCLLSLIFKNREYEFLKFKNARKFQNFLKTKTNIIFTFFLIILAYSILNINKINFDADALNLKDQDLQSVKLAKDLIEKNPTSDYVISIIFDNDNIKNFDESHPIFDSEHIGSYFYYNKIFQKYDSEELEYLKFLLSSKKLIKSNQEKNQIDRLQSLLNNFYENDFGKVSNEAKILKDEISSFNKENNSSYEIRDILFNNFKDLIFFINDLGNVPNDLRNQISDNFTKRYVSPDNLYRVEIFPIKDLSNPSNLKNFVESVENYFPNATGMPVVQYRAGEVVVNSFKIAFLISFSFLIFYLYFVFKKTSYVLLCLASLIAAFILTIFNLIVLKLNLNFANMIALPLLFSLGISYPIYLLKRFEETGNVEKLFSTNTPLAILFSGLTTIFSFSTLFFSSHNGTSSMGLLLFVCLLNTIITSLILLPILLKTFKIK